MTREILAALGQVLYDADLAEAILDRLVEHGTFYLPRVDPDDAGTTRRR